MYDELQKLDYNSCRDKFVSYIKSSDSIRLIIILRSDKAAMGSYIDGSEIAMVYDRVSLKPFLIIERISFNNDEEVKKCERFVSTADVGNHVLNFVKNAERGSCDITFLDKETYELLSADS